MILLANAVVVLANTIAVIAIIVPAYFAWKSMTRKQEQVHVLVNARLDAALTTIERLEAEIAALHITVESLGGPPAPDS